MKKSVKEAPAMDYITKNELLECASELTGLQHDLACRIQLAQQAAVTSTVLSPSASVELILRLQRIQDVVMARCNREINQLYDLAQ